MRIQTLILTVLGGLLLGGCACEPPEANFDISEDLTDDEWGQIADFWGEADTEEVYCKQLCRSAYRRLSGWEANNIERCVLDVAIAEPDTGDASGTMPTPESAIVECSGTALEYICEE